MMKTQKHVILGALAVFASLVMAADPEPNACKAHDCSNSYDLSPLTAGTDYKFTSHSGRNFTLNVCRGVADEMWNPRVDDPKAVGGFTRGAHGDISLGLANTTLHVRDGHPVLLMLGGSSCPQSDAMKASTAIRFICDVTVTEGTPQLIAQLPPEDDDACAFFIEWRTKYACPLPKRGAIWKVIVTSSVIVLALLLTLVGLLAMHKLLKRRRAESSIPPSLAGPSSWPSAIAENARDLGRLLRGQDPWGHPNGSGGLPTANGGGRLGGWGWKPRLFGRSRRDRRDFSRLPQSAEEEAMMGNVADGRFSLDDEDEGNGHLGTNGVAAEDYAEESAAWGAQRAKGIDGSGVIRL